MSDGVFDRLADADLSNSALRNEAASYLQAIYGDARIEERVGSKKVDVLCNVRDFGGSVQVQRRTTMAVR
jgi:hypothetical protein